MLGLKEYWGAEGGLPPIAGCRHQSGRKSPGKVQLAQPAAPPCPLRPIPGSHRDPRPPQKRPRLRTRGSLAARCPFTLLFSRIGDAGHARVWVSGANTPLPKHPACPVRHTLSPQPASSPCPPHNGPLSSGHSTLACPLGPRPKTAAGSESSKEELVSQPLPASSPSALPGPPSSAGLRWQHQGEGCRPLRPRGAGKDPPRPTLRACPLSPRHRGKRSARPQGSETSVLGRSDPPHGPEGRAPLQAPGSLVPEPERPHGSRRG